MDWVFLELSIRSTTAWGATCSRSLAHWRCEKGASATVRHSEMARCLRNSECSSICDSATGDAEEEDDDEEDEEDEEDGEEAGSEEEEEEEPWE